MGTVPEVNGWARYVGNGATLNYAYGFAIATTSEILVMQDDDLLTYSTHYTLTGVGGTSGGLVVMNYFAPDGALITIVRRQAISQLVNLLANSSYPPLTIGASLDNLTKVDQMLAERIGRSIVFRLKSTYRDVIIEDPVAGEFLRWNSDLDGIESVTPTTLDTGTIATLAANRIVFATSTTELDTDADLLWTDATKKLTVGSTGAFDTVVAAAAHHQFQATATPSDTNEWGVSIQLSVPTDTAGAANWKGALIVQTSNGSTAGAFAADVSSIVAQTKNIATSDGRSVSVVAEAYNTTGTDGLLIALEAGIANLGTVVTNPNAALKKINIWLASHTALGYSKATAGIAFSEDTLGWHYGIYMRNITDSFIILTEPGSGGSVNGIHFINSANWANPIILPNNKAIAVYNAGGSATRNVFLMDASDILAIGQDASAAGVALFHGASSTLKTATMADDETGIFVRRRLAGVETEQRVSMGIADSGGVGFRLLRVPN